MMMVKKVYLLSIFAVILVTILCIYIALSSDILAKVRYSLERNGITNEIACYNHNSVIGSFPDLDEIKEHRRLSSGRNIFFHETSCSNEAGHSTFNCRQACAVESAALSNPNTMVNLLFLNPLPPSNSAKRLVNTLLIYYNVKINRILLNNYVVGTPAEAWYKSGRLMESSWPTSHTSDLMRFLTLWKFSGIYLDLDVVVTKSLEDLTDFAGAESSQAINSAVLGISKSLTGQEIANATIHDFVNNFRGDIWGHNGPGVISRTLQKFCRVSNITAILDAACNGFTIFPPSVFYPVPYQSWRLYFSRDNADSTMDLIDNAKAIHVWNKLSASEILQIGSGVPYDLVAKKYCPRVYSSCDDTM